MAKAKEIAEPKDVRYTNMQKLADLINKSQFGGENHDIASVLGGTVVSNVERFTTGSREIDEAFGGGVPVGKIIEFFGGESAGKSTLCYHLIANFQRTYPSRGILLLDTEHSYDPLYAEALGVLSEGITHVEPDTGIAALNIAKLAAESECDVGLIIIDSIAALTTKSDDSGEIGEQMMAEQARMVSQALRVINSVCPRKKITVVCTNQVREAIGQAYGDKTVTPAGKALKHYAHIRAKLTKIGNIKQGSGDNVVTIGIEGKIDCVKNKVAPPFRKAKYTITFGIGIDFVAGLVNTALAKGVMVKRGSWFSFGAEQLGQGLPAVIDFVRNHEEVKNAIDKALDDLKNVVTEDSKMTDAEQAEAEAEETADVEVETV